MSKIPEGATHFFNGVTPQYKKLRHGSRSMWLTCVDGYWYDTINPTPEMYIPINNELTGERMAAAYKMCEVAKSLTNNDAASLYDAGLRFVEATK